MRRRIGPAGHSRHVGGGRFETVGDGRDGSGRVKLVTQRWADGAPPLVALGAQRELARSEVSRGPRVNPDSKCGETLLLLMLGAGGCQNLCATRVVRACVRAHVESHGRKLVERLVVWH